MSDVSKNLKNTDRTEHDPGRVGGENLCDSSDHQQLGEGKKSDGHRNAGNFCVKRAGLILDMPA